VSAGFAVDVDTSVLEALDFTLPCEHGGHGSGTYTMHDKDGIPALFTRHGEGPAEWQSRSFCPSCFVKRELLVCSNRRQHVLKLIATHSRFLCRECLQWGAAKEWNCTFTPLGGDS
jgi:hypothetical protein